MTAPRTYPDGFFTELVYAHNWPPGYESQVTVQTWGPLQRSEAAARGRQTQLDNGFSGSIGDMGTPDPRMARVQFNARERS